MVAVTLSFKGFLLKYLQELTECRTSSIKTLFGLVNDDAPRAAEALMLFALVCGREDYLLRWARGTVFESRYRGALLNFKRSGLSLEEWVASLPDQNRYRKVWNSWLSVSTSLERDRRMLPRVRDAIEGVLQQRNMSRAQACREVGLNKGNFYAFMKGDASKLSRKTAVAAYRALAEG